MSKPDHIDYTISSGNVFADLGLADSDILFTRAELGRSIRKILEEQGFNSKQAAEILIVDQQKIEELMDGIYHQFSEGQYLAFLNRLNYTTTITITPTKHGEAQQLIAVS